MSGEYVAAAWLFGWAVALTVYGIRIELRKREAR